MPSNWTPRPWSPTPGFGGQPAPLPRINPVGPATQYYGPGPIDPNAPVQPALPTNPGAVIDLRPGYAPGNYFGFGGSGLPPLNYGRIGAQAAGGILGGPLGSLAANMLYNRFFGTDTAALPPPLIRNPNLPSGYDVPYFIRDPDIEGEVPQQDADGYMDWLDQQQAQRNLMQSRRRPGSTRFSQGEMDLSNLPMYGAPGSLMPAVFAGERGSPLPGGQVYQEQR